MTVPKNYLFLTIPFLAISLYASEHDNDNEFVKQIIHKASNNQQLSSDEQDLIHTLNFDEVCALHIAVNNARMIADGSNRQIPFNWVVKNLLAARASVSRSGGAQIFNLPDFQNRCITPLQLALHPTSANSVLKKMLLQKICKDCQAHPMVVDYCQWHDKEHQYSDDEKSCA